MLKSILALFSNVNDFLVFVRNKSVRSLITQDKVATIKHSMLFSNVSDVFLFAMQYFFFKLVYDKSFDLSRVNSIGHTIV